MQFDYNSLQHASVSFSVLPADFSKFASKASQWKARLKKNYFFPVAGNSTNVSILLYLKQRQNPQFDKEFSSKCQCGETKNVYYVNVKVSAWLLGCFIMLIVQAAQAARS